VISDEHQSGVNPLILRRFLDFFNGEKPPPGAAPKRGVGGSNPFRDARKTAVSLYFKGFAAFFVFPPIKRLLLPTANFFCYRALKKVC